MDFDSQDRYDISGDFLDQTSEIIREVENAIVDYEEENIRDLKIIHDKDTDPEEARFVMNRLIARNMKLCEAVAFKYYYSVSAKERDNSASRFELEECKQICAIAMFSSIKTFNVAGEHCKFSTWAVNNMHYKLMRYRDTSLSGVRTPVSTTILIRTLLRKYNLTDPSDLEFYECVRNDNELAETTKGTIFSALNTFSVNSVEIFKTFSEDTAKANIDSGYNAIAGNDDTEEIVFKKMMKEKFIKIINTTADLNEKERDTLNGRLAGKTFGEIGEKYGVTRESARNYLKSAIFKIKEKLDEEGITIEDFTEL